MLMQLNSLWQSQLSTSSQLLCRQVVGLSDDPFCTQSGPVVALKIWMKHSCICFAFLTSVIQWSMSMFEEEIIADHLHRNHEHHEQSPCTAYRYRNWKLKSQATATSPRFVGQALNFDCFQAFWIPFGELIGWCRDTGATGSVKIDVKSQHILEHIFCAAVEDCFL